MSSARRRPAELRAYRISKHVARTALVDAKPVDERSPRGCRTAPRTGDDRLGPDQRGRRTRSAPGGGSGRPVVPSNQRAPCQASEPHPVIAEGGTRSTPASATRCAGVGSTHSRDVAAVAGAPPVRPSPCSRLAVRTGRAHTRRTGRTTPCSAPNASMHRRLPAPPQRRRVALHRPPDVGVVPDVRVGPPACRRHEGLGLPRPGGVGGGGEVDGAHVGGAVVVGVDGGRPAGAGGEVLAGAAEVRRGGGGRVVEVLGVGGAVAVTVAGPGLPRSRAGTAAGRPRGPSPGRRAAARSRRSAADRGDRAGAVEAGPMIGDDGRPSAPSTRPPRVPCCDSTQPMPARVVQPRPQPTRRGPAWPGRTPPRRARGSRPRPPYGGPSRDRPSAGSDAGRRATAGDGGGAGGGWARPGRRPGGAEHRVAGGARAAGRARPPR